MTMLRHTVLLRFRSDATENQIQSVLDGLATMPQKMSFIRRYEFGRDVGLLEENPHLAIVADFDSAEDWKKYQEHPDHQALLRDSISPILESMTRVQYEVG